MVQSIDYATGADLRPHLTYGGRRVPCRAARKSFKYLGCLGDLTLNFREERTRILQRTAETAGLLRKHNHDPTQMIELARSSILPLFQYSCAFVNWSLHDLDEVGKLWNRAFKHARLLGPSTAAALLHFPADHGGLEVPLPRVILMKELETFFTQCTEGRGSTANIITRWMRQDRHDL